MAQQYDSQELVRLRSGQDVMVRPLMADDSDRLAAAVATMSDATRYHRYHNFLVELPEGLRDRLLDIDHHHTEALVALTPSTGQIVAGARFTRIADEPHVADLAFIVVDDWQRRGLAAHLLWRLARRAAEEDVDWFVGEILAANRPALELVQRLGPVGLSSEDMVVNARMKVRDWPDADHSGAVVIRARD